MHDFVVVYRKTDAFTRELLPRSESAEANYDNPDQDSRGDWISAGYIGNKSRSQRPNSWFPVTRPKDGKQIWPDEQAVWRFSPKTHAKNVRENRLYWGPDGLYEKPRFKKFRFEVKPGVVPGSWWEPGDTGNNDKAKRELTEVMGTEAVFPNPKPLGLVERILRIATEEDDLVLDSFAGSGTTGHAVMRLNNEDGGTRRFVLVQQPYDTKTDEENKFNICERVTAVRAARAATGYPYQGTRDDVLLEERLTFATLRKADEVLARIAAARTANQSQYPSIRVDTKDSTIRVIGSVEIAEAAPGLGGSFTYTHLGPPLYGEYKNFGEKLPSFEEIARYVFYTETSRQADAKKFDEETGFIGSMRAAGGTSYYLLYTPNHKEDRELSTTSLKAIAKRDKAKNLVIYCEKIWIHPDELRKFEKENKVSVRPMLVPFNLK